MTTSSSRSSITSPLLLDYARKVGANVSGIPTPAAPASVAAPVQQKAPILTSTGTYAQPTSSGVKQVASAPKQTTQQPLLSASRNQASNQQIDPRSATLYGSGNANISNADIQNFLRNAQSNDDILKAATTYGVSAQQISNAMGGQNGFDMDSINKYLASQGISQPKQIDNQPPVVSSSSGSTNNSIQNVGGTNTPTWPTMIWVQPQQVQAPPPVAPEDVGVRNVDYRPATQTQARINPQTGTIEGRLDNLLNPNSLLMQRAATAGAQYANNRGLLNSSIGATAGQSAMIDAALQIASPDAGAYQQYGLANANAANQIGMFNSQLGMDASRINAENALKAGMFNSDSGLKAGMFNADNLLRTGMFNAESALKSDMFNSDKFSTLNMFDQEMAFKNRTFDVEQANQTLWRQMDNDTRLKAIDLSAKYDKEINSISGANGLYNNTMQLIAQAQSSDLPPEAKQQAVDNLLQMLDRGLSLTSALSGADFSSILDFSKYTTGGQSGSTQAAAANNATTQNQSTSSGTTSLLTGEPLGASRSNPEVFNTIGGQMPTPVVESLKKIYGDQIDPRFIISEEQISDNRTRATTDPNNLGNRTFDPFAKMSAESAKRLQEGAKNGSVMVLQVRDPQYGMPFSPELGWFAQGHVYYDPNNVAGLAG